LEEEPAAQQLILELEAVFEPAPHPWVFSFAATCVGETLTKVLVVGSKLSATKDTSPLCAAVSLLTYVTSPVTGFVLGSMVASSEATFAAAVWYSEGIGVAAEATLTSQEDLDLSVQDLEQPACWAWAAKARQSNRLMEKSTFFMNSFIYLLI
jgi:hypothetical protein